MAPHPGLACANSIIESPIRASACRMAPFLSRIENFSLAPKAFLMNSRKFFALSTMRYGVKLRNPSGIALFALTMWVSLLWTVLRTHPDGSGKLRIVKILSAQGQFHLAQI